jgi:hypothetical protein
MSPRQAYSRSGELVAAVVRDEVLPGVISSLRNSIISGAAVMFSGAVSWSEFRWRRGGRYRKLPQSVLARVEDFCTIYGGTKRDAHYGELMAIAIVGDEWKAIRKIARRLLEGRRVADSHVRRLVCGAGAKT